jgi:hypothetical protein
MGTNVRRLLLVAVLAVAVTASCNLTQEELDVAYHLTGALLVAWLSFYVVFLI